MAPVTPDRNRIRSFESAAAFETWLAAHHASETELWLKIFKKRSGTPTVTYPEALDIALCWGWIDGLKKAFDDTAFLQRFTPRRPKSIWSQINRDHVARLIAAGRMTPHGQRHIDAAKADGRWDAAYAAIRDTTVDSVPDDLRAAIDANPRARQAFRTLGRQELFAMVFRTHNMKTAAGRAKKIAALVDKLAKDGSIFSNGPGKPAAGKPAAGKSAARTPATGKPAVGKPAASKSAASKSAARKSAARKSAARKPAASKSAARTPTARKPARRT